MGKWLCLLAVVAAGTVTALALNAPDTSEIQDNVSVGTDRQRLAYDPQDHAAPQAPAPEFLPRDIVPPFPVIREVPIETADAGDRELSPKELVLGVQVGGHARAYPINMLCGPSREIINDTIGGRSIAATW